MQQNPYLSELLADFFVTMTA